MRTFADIPAEVERLPGPRLADVCVLPAAGRMAWLRRYEGRSTSFRGHHGGLHPDETDTWVGTLYS